MSLLSVRNIVKKFNGVTALNGVSFNVEDGQILGVIGPNGSGKTTLLNLITGIFAPTSGQITFMGKSVIGRKPYEIARQGIGRTFQQIRLFDQLTVLENVLVGLDFHLDIGYGAAVLDSRKARAEEMRGRTQAKEILSRIRSNLEVDYGRRASELPYADKRRLEIARALATRPRLLLLDEPAAGMAPQEMRKLVDDLRQLNADGTAIILIEHKMRLIEGVTDRVVVLDYGEKIAEGRFEDIRRDKRVIEAYLGRDYANAGVAAG
jgi:ABC-type branched-subunit amino acid transport system ATPase component